MNRILNRTRLQHGFSLLETMVTLGVVAAVGSMAAASAINARKVMQGDSAMRLVMSQMNRARELAITQRKNMELQFIGGNWVRIVRHETSGIATTVLSSVPLESGAQFAITGGVTDTPDAFGMTGPVSFGAAASIMFTTDGTLIDSGGTPVNGTVFLSIQNQQWSARAVTILGSTGRVRGYKWVVGKTASGWSRV